MRNETPKDTFSVAGREFSSRLLVGTGKYKDMEETRRAIEASGAEIVTIAVRRTNIGQNPDEPNLLEALPLDRYTLLPNTAGCYDAEEAVLPTIATCQACHEDQATQYLAGKHAKGLLAVEALPTGNNQSVHQ